MPSTTTQIGFLIKINLFGAKFLVKPQYFHIHLMHDICDIYNVWLQFLFVHVAAVCHSAYMYPPYPTTPATQLYR